MEWKQHYILYGITVYLPQAKRTAIDMELCTSTAQSNGEMRTVNVHQQTVEMLHCTMIAVCEMHIRRISHTPLYVSLASFTVNLLHYFCCFCFCL